MPIAKPAAVPQNRSGGLCLGRGRRLGLLALALLLVWVWLWAPAGASARGLCPGETTEILAAPAADVRESVLCVVNETRLQYGLPALHRDARLQSAAQQHTDDMVSSHYFSHPGTGGTTPASRIAAAGYAPAATTGENIFQGVRTPRLVVQGWMDETASTSNGHCENILQPAFRDLGVGVNPGAANLGFGAGTWTQDFGRLTAAAAPSAVTGPMAGCPYDLAPATGGPRPTATTSLATNITASAATLNGTAGANTGGFTSYHVAYGPTTGYGSQTLERIAGTSSATVTEALAGLAAGTYHHQVVAMNQNGETRSVDRTFTTLGSPARPLPVTGAAGDLTQTTATLNGAVNPNSKTTTYHFEYGATTGYGSTSATITAAGTDTIAQAVSAALTGLTAGTVYHVRLVASNSDGTTNGLDQTFTTQPLTPPIVVTAAASAIGPTVATLNGSVNPNGKATTYRFDYGTTTSYGSTTATVAAGSGTAAQAIIAPLSGLAAATVYYARVVAINADGTTNGMPVTFTTAPFTPPIVATGSASAVGSTIATLNGTINPNGKATSYHFEYGTTMSYGASSAGTAAGSGTTAQAVSAPVGGLTASTTYYARLVAINADGTTNGMPVSFATTALAPPTAVTGPASAVGPTVATLNGSVNPHGRATTYHFDYGTSTSYGSSTASATAGSGATAQAVSAPVSGLTASTTYHVRLVATSADGYSAGSDTTYTTPPPEIVVPPVPTPPIVTAAPATGVGQTTAALNGTVNPAGQATTYHFVYGTSTSYGSATAMVPAGSAGTAQAVRAVVTGLQPRTTYHVRLVATNADGTSAAPDGVFTTTAADVTPPPPPPPPPAPAAVAGLRVSPSAFRAARSGASVAKATVRGRAQVRYTLNVAAGVRFAVERASSGRRAGGRCVKANRANRARTRCTRYARVTGSFSRTRAPGADRFVFTGRVAGRALKPGGYRLLATPTANARAGKTARREFRIKQ